MAGATSTLSSIATGRQATKRAWWLLQHPLLPGLKLSAGFSFFYLTLVVLLPIAALFVYVSDLTWAQYWHAITHPRVVSSYVVTLKAAFYSTVLALAIGFLFAWVIARYEFQGRGFLDACMDVPFALPTSVAGLTLAALWMPNGWLGQWLAPMGVKVSYAFPGIVVAMTFTSLPFVVRVVQPVIEALGIEHEEAAYLLGATASQRFFRVLLPPLFPALLTGAGQAFIRSLGEFGAVMMIAGNIPFKTEVGSLMIFVRLQEFEYGAAAAIASVILFASLILLFLLQWAQRRLSRWQ